jgi:hypothetical protein
MLAYRVYAIDEDGHISGPADIIGAADEAACQEAKLAADLRSRARDSRIGRQGIFGRDVIRRASRNCRTTFEAGKFRRIANRRRGIRAAQPGGE